MLTPPPYSSQNGPPGDLESRFVISIILLFILLQVLISMLMKILTSTRSHTTSKYCRSKAMQILYKVLLPYRMVRPSVKRAIDFRSRWENRTHWLYNSPSPQLHVYFCVNYFIWCLVRFYGSHSLSVNSGCEVLTCSNFSRLFDQPGKCQADGGWVRFKSKHSIQNKCLRRKSFEIVFCLANAVSGIFAMNVKAHCHFIYVTVNSFMKIFFIPTRSVAPF